MKALAIIPARGGSKRIPGKNVLDLCGTPLIGYSIEQAKKSKTINRVIVSTNDDEIKRVSESFGAEVILRPEDLASDTSSSESALIHALDHLKESEGYEPDVVVFLQATSPLRDYTDIDNAVSAFLTEGCDSVFSACVNDKLIWAKTSTGLKALNYDYENRKREQDMEVQFRENGSIYVFTPRLLREKNNRLGGNIKVYEMSYLNSFQIDSLEDVKLMTWIINGRKGEGEAI